MLYMQAQVASGKIKLNFADFGLYRMGSDGYYDGLSINEIEAVGFI